MEIENELNFRDRMNIIQVLFLTLEYHQGYNFIPSVKHVGKKLNEDGPKDEMQNILKFKDENIAWAIFQGQDGYFNWKRKRNRSSTNALFLNYYKISKAF